MKGLTPAKLVEICDQVVVVIDEHLIMLFSEFWGARCMKSRVLVNHGLYLARRKVRKGTRA